MGFDLGVSQRSRVCVYTKKLQLQIMEYKVTPQLHEASPPTDFRAPVEKHVATPQKKNKKKKQQNPAKQTQTDFYGKTRDSNFLLYFMLYCCQSHLHPCVQLNILELQHLFWLASAGGAHSCFQNLNTFFSKNKNPLLLLVRFKVCV